MSKFNNLSIVQNSDYFKKVVMRHLLELEQFANNSKNEIGRIFYVNRIEKQLNDYAQCLNISENEIEYIIDLSMN
jgi:hypothetical protein